MNLNSGLDRQAFEAFLANAFAVQKSGLDTQSLAAVVEVQRFISMAEPNMDRALELIADCSLKVSNASGVAIARLESNQLIYCAATGSAAKELGRRLPAVLSLRGETEGKAEILRVENAPTDSRIQAEICRQFGATSLLILPIWHQHVITGILQVHFSEAHVFLDREVRAYRLMAGLAADAISGAVSHAPTKAPMAVVGTMDVIQRYISHDNALSANNKRSSEDVQAPTDLIPELEKLAKLGSAAAKKCARAAREFLADHVWEWETVSAAVLLAITLAIAHFHRPAATTLGSTISAAITPEKLPDNAVSTNDRWKRSDHGVRDEMAPSAAFRRVKIGPDEVDYIAADVTIKHFTNNQARPKRNVKLVNIGDDVTVRYFSSEPVSQATPFSTTQKTK